MTPAPWPECHGLGEGGVAGAGAADCGPPSQDTATAREATAESGVGAARRLCAKSRPQPHRPLRADT